MKCRGPQVPLDRPRLRLKADVVVDGIPQSLFAAQVPFGCLDADVPEQELNLFEFSPGLVTQARACTPEMPHAAFAPLISIGAAVAR